MVPCLHTESDCVFFNPTQKKTATLNGQPTLPTSSLFGWGLRGLSSPGPAGHNLHG